MEEMNQYEIIDKVIDLYKLLQSIKNANGNQINPILEYELKTTRVKLEKFGVNLSDLEMPQ